MQRRCDRNRKRSKRRAIYCPVHECYLDSVSQKHRLFAQRSEHVRQQGIEQRNSLLLEDEWLEAFWCEQCQKTKWYHVRKRENSTYSISVASPTPKFAGHW